MIRLELFREFQVDLVVPRYEHIGDAMKEESKRFKLVDEEFIDKATIGLRLQQMIAEEHIKDLVETRHLEKEQAEAESKLLIRDIVSKIGRDKQLLVRSGGELAKPAQVPSKSVKTGVQIGVVPSSN